MLTDTPKDLRLKSSLAPRTSGAGAVFDAVAVRFGTSLDADTLEDALVT